MTFELGLIFVGVLVAVFAAFLLGRHIGRLHEKARWVEASMRADHWLNDSTSGDFIVMERGRFWVDWSNPLARARRSGAL